mgnify:CR=1 FL=1
MTQYIPPAIDWVREQVELYEGSGGTEGTTLRDTGLPCIIVTHMGNQSGAIRKIPLMKVKVGDSYVLVGSFPPYNDYQKKAPRKIPVFLAEPV